MAERTVLNFLQRLCAISTLTKEFVDRIADTPMRILDTRKTTPGMRHLEKYAVTCGGGVNHRLGLYDAIMIKNNHIDILGGMKKTIQKLPLQKPGDRPVIVEVRTLEELNLVLESAKEKINRILFDNVNLEDLRKGVKMCQGLFKTEASGGIHLENIRAIAQTGVDFASVGGITHSAGCIDLSMHMET
jgi:nicotinate-nucleotide pyrophosphorylase (carboxylating)